MPLAPSAIGQTFPRFQGILINNFNPTALTLSTAGGPRTLTAAELLSGILSVDCQDAQTLNLPTAAQIQEAIGFLAIGQGFTVYLRNIGDSICTVAVNTGITNAPGNTLTVAPVSTRTFVLRCTAVGLTSDPGTTAAYTVYSMGVSLH